MALKEITQGLRGSEAANIIYDNDNWLSEEIETLRRTLETLQQLLAVFTGKGAMLLWNRPANEIPKGWKEVENWRGRLPAGWDPSQEEFNIVGKKGGSKNFKINPNNIPPGAFYLKDTAWWGVGAGSRQTALRLTPGTNFPLNAGGNGDAITHLNPYRVVVFIEWVG